MNFVNTLIVDGQSYIVQDPNAVTRQQLQTEVEEMVADLFAALPVYNGEVEAV